MTEAYTMWACDECSATFPEPTRGHNGNKAPWCPDCGSDRIWAYHETGCEDPPAEVDNGRQCVVCGATLDMMDSYLNTCREH